VVPTLAIKDQLRHTSVKTTIDFHIGLDEGYQREECVLNIVEI